MNGIGARVPLYDRLPEIYRIRDAEQLPPDQLRAYLAAVEEVFGAVHESIEGLYQDLFIDTCQDWVVPYLGDLLGSTHLSGDPRTLRADVADTIALRRRKGTREAIERLAANLTGWPCRAVELFERLAWAQQLNHQRPDAGGRPPYGAPTLTRFAVPRGGTVPVRDPAMLSLLGTPFDPFACTPDVKRADDGALHPNLPNLAVFLWRLAPYRLPVTRPLARGVTDLGPPPAGSGRARYAVRFDLDPLDRPVRLFNTWRRPAPDPVHGGRTLTEPDAVPGPIPDARLTTGSEAGNPSAYVRVDAYDPATTPPGGLDLSDAGLQLYLPDAPELHGIPWTFRGDNLCAWEEGLRRPLLAHEVVIDPDIGRVLMGARVAAERDTLVDDLGGGAFDALVFVGYTYGAPGPVGAHPVSRGGTPAEIDGRPAQLRQVNALAGATLQAALEDLHEAVGPVVVEIDDSLVHPLDPSALGGVVVEGGVATLRLAAPLVIRASSGQRPVIRLEAPLAFRPVDPGDPSVLSLSVRLEGLYLTRDAGLAGTEPLIARAALARLDIDGCTLDPGGHRLRDGTRAPLSPALRLVEGFGFASDADLDAFEPTPDVFVRRSVTGALLVDDRYRLVLEASVVDAGQGPRDPAGTAHAVGPTSDPDVRWGAPLEVRGAHLLGRTRVAEGVGSGALFAQRLEVWNHQRGCLKHCWFSGDGDRLPPHHACVRGPGARLSFTSLWHGDPGYGQLARWSDPRVLTRGPGDDQMGAYGFLLEAHRTANLAVRLRECMPVGVRPLIIAVT